MNMFTQHCPSQPARMPGIFWQRYASSPHLDHQFSPPQSGCGTSTPPGPSARRMHTRFVESGSRKFPTTTDGLPHHRLHHRRAVRRITSIILALAQGSPSHPPREHLATRLRRLTNRVLLSSCRRHPALPRHVLSPDHGTSGAEAAFHSSLATPGRSLPPPRRTLGISALLVQI